MRDASRKPPATIPSENIAMRPIHATVLATFLFATTAHAGADTRTRYLELINRAHDSVTSFAIATAGSDVFRDMPLGASLRGGGEAATLEVAADSCVQDLRFGFRNGRTLIYQGVDICRHPRVHIRLLPRPAASGQSLLGQARDADRSTP